MREPLNRLISPAGGKVPRNSTVVASAKHLTSVNMASVSSISVIQLATLLSSIKPILKTQTPSTSTSLMCHYKLLCCVVTVYLDVEPQVAMFISDLSR